MIRWRQNKVSIFPDSFGRMSMKRIAFCDDDRAFLSYAADLVEDRFDQLHFPVEVDTYTDPVIFLEHISEEPVDAVFLDMVMPSLDGLLVGQAIRDRIRSRMIPVIFLSSHDSLVYKALKVQPLRFIRKNHFQEEIDEAIAAVIALFRESDADTIAIRTERKSVLLRINEIVYIESLQKRQVIHMLDGKAYETRITLADLEESLSEHYYVRPHKSYLVNASHIVVINTDDLVLRGGVSIPMSRHRKEAVKQSFVRRQTRLL